MTVGKKQTEMIEDQVSHHCVTYFNHKITK